MALYLDEIDELTLNLSPMEVESEKVLSSAGFSTESPGLTESSERSVGSSDTTGREKRKRRRKDEDFQQQERWIANLEHSNTALSGSVEMLTRGAKAGEARERDLTSANNDLKDKVTQYEDKIAKLEKALLHHKQEVETLRQDNITVDRSDFARENIELKENLKAVAQLVLSTPLDARTTKLLQVLTAPVGGLSAVGSRSGVLGLDKENKQNTESITPLELMGAAVKGPVPDNPHNSNPLSSMLVSKGKCSGVKVDFGFTFGKKKTPTLFGVMLGVGVTYFVSLDSVLTPPEGRHHHLPPQPATRKLLETKSAPPVPNLLCHGLFFVGIMLVCVVCVQFIASKISLTRSPPQKDEPLLPHTTPERSSSS